ncbi:hypothetical protein V493_03609 [Pseudogymnoascus sp. VKM F-4281 (FW-2241)]|nr:hypothetical protein V493_03609 [Pseudogymnoascus sp. VKM F-4281 (FW-2241)]
MKANVLSTLGVFTTFCQPVSSCVYGSSILPRADGGLENSQFGYTDSTESLHWWQLITNADESELVNVGATVDALVDETIRTTTNSNVLRRVDVDISTGHRDIGEYLSMGGYFGFHTAGIVTLLCFPWDISESALADMSVASAAFLAPLDKTYSTQVFDTVLSPVSHVVEFAQITTATAELLSLTSSNAHPNNNPAMRYSGSFATPSCSEGIDRIISVAPIPFSNAGSLRTPGKVMRSKAAKASTALK